MRRKRIIYVILLNQENQVLDPKMRRRHIMTKIIIRHSIFIITAYDRSVRSFPFAHPGDNQLLCMPLRVGSCTRTLKK